MVRNNKYCKKCGTKIEASDNFCEKCGTKTSDVKTKERNRTLLQTKFKKLSPEEKVQSEENWGGAVGLILFTTFGFWCLWVFIFAEPVEYESITPEQKATLKELRKENQNKAEYVTQKEKDAGLTDLDIVNWCNDGCRLLFETYAEIDECVDSCLKEP